MPGTGKWRWIFRRGAGEKRSLKGSSAKLQGGRQYRLKKDWHKRAAGSFCPVGEIRTQDAPSFWACYEGLPEDVRQRADKQYERLASDSAHPSVHLKPVGQFWSARATDAVRALAVREENTFIWFWVGTHDEYQRLLRG
jgi:hypothetical protein